MNSDTSKCGRTGKDNLWLTSGNTLFVLCTYTTESQNHTWLCHLMLQLVIVQVLTFVAWVQLCQNKLAQTSVSCTLHILLYCNTYTALQPSVCRVAGIVPYLSDMIQEHIPVKGSFSTDSSHRSLFVLHFRREL